MSAEGEIRRLMFRYARLIDDGDFAAVGALFESACIVAPDGTECHGADNITALYEHSARIYPETGTPCTQHVTTNVSILVEGDHATAQSCFTVLQALPDFPLQAIIAGRYEDEFSRGSGHWRFTRRRIEPRLLGDLSRHLLVEL